MERGKVSGLAHVYGPDGKLKAELRLFMETDLSEQEVREIVKVHKENPDGDHSLDSHAEHAG